MSRPVTYDKRIPVALTAEQLERIDVAAASVGLTRSAWLRMVALKAAALVGALLLAVGCTFDVDGEALDPGAPLEPTPPTARPVVRPWATAHQAVTAECSGLCRWEVRCLPDVDLGSCEATCHAQICAGVDCDLPPSGTDAELEQCIHYLQVEAASPFACASGETPYTYGERCEAVVRPAAMPIEPRL